MSKEKKVGSHYPVLEQGRSDELTLAHWGKGVSGESFMEQREGKGSNCSSSKKKESQCATIMC